MTVRAAGFASRTIKSAPIAGTSRKWPSGLAPDRHPLRAGRAGREPMALTCAPDGLLGRRPALDIRRIVEAHQVGRPLVRPDPQLPAVAAQARVGRTLRERGLVGEGRAEQPGELAARALWPLRTRRRPVTCYEEPHRRPSRSRGSQGAPASAWTAKASEPPGPLLRWTTSGRPRWRSHRYCS